MALRVNATMRFDSYTVEDNGIQFHFVCIDPGPGMNSDYYVLVTDAELTGVTSQAQLASLITTKLQRRYRATGAASKLDPFIGQTLVI